MPEQTLKARPCLLYPKPCPILARPCQHRQQHPSLPPQQVEVLFLELIVEQVFVGHHLPCLLAVGQTQTTTTWSGGVRGNGPRVGWAEAPGGGTQVKRCDQAVRGAVAPRMVDGAVAQGVRLGGL